jgi:hypothetical protein
MLNSLFKTYRDLIDELYVILIIKIITAINVKYAVGNLVKYGRI